VTYTPEQPQQPEHAAASYYPAPAFAPEPPKNLTALGVLAFASATLATLFTAVDASVIGRAVRTGGDQGGDLESLDWSVGVYYLGNMLTFAALVGAWVTGSMWLFRARKNAEVLAPGYHHARSSGWAWGGWICPIVSFWFPFQLVRDVHKAVTPLGLTTIIGWWWGLFLTVVIGWRISDRVESDALASGTGASDVQGFAIFLAVVMVAALLAWGLVLRKITVEQHARMYGGRTA
jgi:uncharacterized protein DUF4328